MADQPGEKRGGPGRKGSVNKSWRKKIKLPERIVKVWNPSTKRFNSVPESKLQEYRGKFATEERQQWLQQYHCGVNDVQPESYSQGNETVQPESGATVSASGPASSAEETESRYQQKKMKRLEEWHNVSQLLLKVDTERSGQPPPMKCAHCVSSGEVHLIRCTDCGPAAFFCSKSFDDHHRYMPFHCPDVWNGNVFVPYQPSGLPVLQHSDHNAQCSRKAKIINVTFIQGRQKQVTVEVCTCEPEAVTLLRHSLWAASPTAPTVAFHTELMEWLRVLVLECQVSVHGFVNALSSKLGKFNSLSRAQITQLYRSIVQDAHSQYMHHQYSMLHLKHICADLNVGTECPACDVTDTTTPAIMSMDANFGLVRKKSSGKRYQDSFHQEVFIDQEEVDRYMENYPSKKRGSECSNFKAGDNLRSKEKSKKLDETAVFGAACRHEFPSIFFNLKHGERIGYAVHMLRELMKRNPGKKLVIMYDIACVLHSHLTSQTSRESFVAESLDRVGFVIPIFHSFGHQQSCQLKYGPRRHQGIGLTDGETMERLWSYLRKFSGITKQMSPERRIDLLTQAMIHYAEKLRSNLCHSLIGKQQRADVTLQASSSAIGNISSSFEGTVNDGVLQQWRYEEEEACKAKRRKGNGLAKDDFILALHDLHQAQSNATEEEIQRINSKLEKLETRHGFQRVARDSFEFQTALKEVVSRRREKLQELLISVSGERQRTIRQLSSARGQDMAKKLSSAVKKQSARLNNLLSDYNLYRNVPAIATEKVFLTFIEITSSDMHICSETAVAKRQLLDAIDLHARSLEEQQLVVKEAGASHAWFARHHKACVDQADAIDCTTRYMSGCRALLYEHAFQQECMLVELESAFDITSVRKPVSDHLQMLANGVFQSDSDIEEINQLEIEELIHVYQNGMNVPPYFSASDDEENDASDDEDGLDGI